MTSRSLDWWGFRLTPPGNHEPSPITFLEKVIASLQVASLLLAAWTALLVCLPGFFIDSSMTVTIPLLLLALPLVVVLASPETVLTTIGIGMWMPLSRVRGDLRNWDLGLALFGAMGTALFAWRASGEVRLSGSVLFLVVVLSSILLLFQQRVQVDIQKWEWELPAWLTRRGGREPGTTPDPTGEDFRFPPVMDPDSNVVYQIVKNQVPTPIGINVPAELLDQLRDLNKNSSGQPGVLFLENPAATALLDRDPISFVGQAQLISLSSQIACCCKSYGLTRMQSANLVLGLVQREFKYQYDDDPESAIPGGPFVEYGRLPVETLCDRVGDCECTTILTASLLAYLGFDVAYIDLELHDRDSGETSGHYAIGLNAEGMFLADQGGLVEGLGLISDPNPEKSGNRRKYLYGETTAHGQDLHAFGVFPKSWIEEKEVKILGIIPIPKPYLEPIPAEGGNQSAS